MSGILMIIDRLDRELTSMGFSRKKTTWNRERGPLVDVIDIQTSKSGDTVTMNAGVLSRPTYFACWGREAEPFVEEPECIVRARIGRLIDNKDRWWDVSRLDVSEEIVDCLRAWIFPFLERMQSLEAMRDWLVCTGIPSPKSPLPSIYLAILRYQLGDIDAARAVLAEIEQKALGAWKSRAQEVAARIGCVG